MSDEDDRKAADDGNDSDNNWSQTTQPAGHLVPDAALGARMFESGRMSMLREVVDIMLPHVPNASVEHAYVIHTMNVCKTDHKEASKVGAGIIRDALAAILMG